MTSVDDSKTLHNIDDRVHDIDTRVVVIETEITRMATTRRIILGMSGILLIQLGYMFYWGGQITTKMETNNSAGLATNLVQVRNILGDHSGEFVAARQEIARLRGSIDDLHNYHSSIRQEIDELRETHGDRILRLENYLIQQSQLNKMDTN